MGLFLFFLAQGPSLFVYPSVFLLTVFIWGVLFGVPARIFNRNRMRRCLTAVTVLFFLAAALDVVSKVYFETIPPPALNTQTNTSPNTGAAITDRDTESTITIDPETGETIDSRIDPLGVARVLSIRGRPVDVPDVRMQMKSTASGYLHGTVHNDTGKRIEKLKLSVRTERWTRIHDVKVSVEPNTTKDFIVSIGEASLDVKSFSVLRVLR